MSRKKIAHQKWTKTTLMALGIPAVLIPGILFATTLGWNPKPLASVKDYFHINAVFPYSGIVSTIEDGDTFVLKQGVTIRLNGIDAPGRGEDGYQNAKDMLQTLIVQKSVYLEYDRYQDDKYGRVLSWVWIDCEGEPIFSAPDYMRLSKNQSREGIRENPKNCKNGKLVNEELVKRGAAKQVVYQDRGELKYEERLKKVTALP
jgi:endonuclease YncB( thermonuclease family)